MSGASLARAPAGGDALAELQRAEAAYADFNDAYGAVSLIDSNPGAYPNGYAGRTRDAWRAQYVSRRAELAGSLGQAAAGHLSGSDARALEVMRADIAESSPEPHSLAPAGRCADARRPDETLSGSVADGAPAEKVA